MILRGIQTKCLLAIFVLAAIGAVLAQPLPGIPGYTEQSPNAAPQSSALPRDLAGRWTVTFANGVIETCEIAQVGTATVNEPQRASPGTVRMREGDLLLVFDDDRLERWTRVGSQMVVEHWFPRAAFATERPVLGIAVRSGE